MKQIIISIALLPSLAFAQANKKPAAKPAAAPVVPASQPTPEPAPAVAAEPATKESDHGLRGQRIAVLAHGGYLMSSMSFAYFYQVAYAGKKPADEVRYTREVTAVGGGLNFLMTTPFAKIFYGGVDGGLSFFSVQKYRNPSVSNVTQYEGRIYVDGLLGIAFTENVGLYAGAGFQTYYISPLKVDGTTTDPSFSTLFGTLGINAIAGLHIVLGRIVINPSFMADLALIGTADKDTIHAGSGFATRKDGDIFTGRIAIGYAFQ